MSEEKIGPLSSVLDPIEKSTSLLNVVLYEPDIPGNTGNVARTCVGTNSTLHLVGKLGFSLSDKHLKRAGLDYWKDLDLKVYQNWESFLESIPKPHKLLFFEKETGDDLWNAQYEPEGYLVFGSETRGFPEEMAQRYQSSFYKIPLMGNVRSLNVSSAVAIALYEGIRQLKKQ